MPAPHHRRTSWHETRRCTTPSSCRRDCQSGRRHPYPAEASMPLSFGRDPNAPGVLLSQLPELLLSCRMLMKLLTSVPSTVNVAVVAVAGSAAATSRDRRRHRATQGRGVSICTPYGSTTIVRPGTRTRSSRTMSDAGGTCTDRAPSPNASRSAHRARGGVRSPIRVQCRSRYRCTSLPTSSVRPISTRSLASSGGYGR